MKTFFQEFSMNLTLEEKKKKLQESKKKIEFREKKLLEKERKEKTKKQIKLASFLEKLGLNALDEETLLGAFLDIKEQSHDAKKRELWKKEGTSFLEKREDQNKLPFIVSLDETDAQAVQILKNLKFKWNRFRKEWYGESLKKDLEKALAPFAAKIESLDE